MTEFSLPWSCDNVGDGGPASFTLDVVEATNRLLSNLDPANDGVVYWADTAVLPFTGFSGASTGLLAPTNPGGNTVRIASGVGRVQGWLYASDADTDFDVTDAVIHTSTNLVVLRRDRLAQTVRLALKKAPASGGTATVTQTAATWEVAIAEYRLDAGGNLTLLTDVRELVKPPVGAVTLLDESKLTASAATVTFSGINPLYTHLRLVIQARSDTAATNDQTLLQFNGDTGANYAYLELEWNNTGLITNVLSDPSTFIEISEISGATATASHASPVVVDIPNYAGTTFFKNAMSKTMNFGTGAAAFSVWDNNGVWRNTAAITSLTLDLAFGSFITGSVFSLYGIV